MKLWPHQSRALAEVRRHWQDKRHVLVVSPTGSGKTVMGAELVSGRTLWLAHTRELVAQAAGALRRVHGSEAVSLAYGGSMEDAKRPIQVGTVQTFLNLPGAIKRFAPELLVLDEVHHYRADAWEVVAKRVSGARWLGLTATPQRSDGRALANLFDAHFIAAQRSELIRAGLLVPTRLIQPLKRQRADGRIVASDLVMSPVEAWHLASEGSQSIVYCYRVDDAERFAAEFRSRGVAAEVISGATPDAERDDACARFKAGDVRVLVNVHVLTEGVDVPAARTVILARHFEHWGSYMQAVGRVSRLAPGKADGVVIDLCGSSIEHGSPDADLEYDHTRRDYVPRGSVEATERPTGPVDQVVVGGELVMVSRGALPEGSSIPGGLTMRDPVTVAEVARLVAREKTRDPKRRRFLERNLQGLG